MCKLTTYYMNANFLQNTYHGAFRIYEGDAESADWQALLQDFINDVRDGNYNAELKDAGLIQLDSHTIFPNIHGWRFILYTYVGMKSVAKSIIVIDD